MSLNEIAVDLTCEPEPFKPAMSYVPHEDYQFPATKLPSDAMDTPTYHVHSGILRLARAMGDVGKPVQLAIHEALHRNPDFGAPLMSITRSKAEPLTELVMCGHSLGAGVAALLGLVSQIRYYDNPCP